ncbi:MAG: electron transport complex subunit RsxG [Gammaproteobacteria bacterium]|nr:electron transport complex subunit RsxG [Gammaproteobacteria bacterium]
MASPKSGVFREILLSSLLLGGFAVAGAALLAWTESQTRDRIANNIRRQILDSLYEVLPRETHNNDLINASFEVTDSELLGTDEPVTIYLATMDGRPVGALLNTVAPNGYTGAIKLLVGIYYDGRLAGVRVVEHRETPGLGDQIEITKTDWITHFAGKSLNDPIPQLWAVKRDGGVFDQFTGATVTPRAVVKAVKNTLIYFDANKDALFNLLETETEETVAK